MDLERSILLIISLTLPGEENFNFVGDGLLLVGDVLLLVGEGEEASCDGEAAVVAVSPGGGSGDN